MEAYDKALECPGTPFVSAYLHVNYSQALNYRLDFAGVRQHLQRAVEIDPFLVDAVEKLQAHSDFINRLTSAYKRKGGRIFDLVEVGFRSGGHETTSKSVQIPGPAGFGQRELRQVGVGDRPGAGHEPERGPGRHQPRPGLLLQPGPAVGHQFGP